MGKNIFSKKQIYQLIILSAFLTLLVIVWLVVEKPGQEDVALGQSSIEAEAGAEAVSSMTVYASDSPINTLNVENDAGTYVLRNDAENPIESRNNPKYSIGGFDGLPQNTSMLNAAGAGATRLEATSMVASADEAIHEAYGLTDPRAALYLSFMDGTSTVVLIGDAAPGDSGVYACLVDDEQRLGNVYLVPSAAVTYYTLSAEAFLDRTVTGGSVLSELYEITLGGTFRGDAPIVIAAQGEGENAVLTMTAPFGRPLDSMNLATLKSVYGLALEVAAVSADEEVLETLGLAEPYSTAQVSGGEDVGSFTLLASQPDESGMVYLMREGTDMIYVATAADVPWLEVTAFELIDKALYPVKAGQLAQLTVSTEEQSCVYDLSALEQGTVRVTANGGANTVSAEAFRAFYELAATAPLDAYSAELPPEDATFRMGLTGVKQDGTATQMMVYNGPVRKCYVVIDNEHCFLISSSHIDAALDAFGTLNAGMKPEQ